MDILWLSLFLLSMVVGIGLNLFGLAGNWLMFASAIAYHLFIDAAEARFGMTLGVVVVLGLLARILPAWRAARLDPVRALNTI